MPKNLTNSAGKGLVEPVETTPVYHPMPYSPTESGFTTRAHVYRKLYALPRGKTNLTPDLSNVHP